MGERFWRSPLAVLVACAALLDPGAMPAAPVAVRHAEGWSTVSWCCARWRVRLSLTVI